MRRILALARRLRRDCPWDRAQDLASFKTCVRKEVREITEAINEGDPAHIAEEIGDTLWNLAFLVVLCEERRWFGFDTVRDGILAKMVRRHPHVFGDAKAETPAEAIALFNRLKAREWKSPPAAARRPTPPPPSGGRRGGGRSPRS